MMIGSDSVIPAIGLRIRPRARAGLSRGRDSVTVTRAGRGRGRIRRRTVDHVTRRGHGPAAGGPGRAARPSYPAARLCGSPY
eukprot:757785-Hanusia_phi.AAC.1